MPSPGSRAALIVEDERIVANDLKQTLMDLGFDAVDIASSAEEAMARSRERRPDVAIVDVRIKGKLDGIKTARLLQEAFDVAIVYTTAHADDATLERALRTRPYGYLVKPIKAAELRTTIEIALRARDAQEGAHGAGATPPEDSAARPTAPDIHPPDAQAVYRQVDHILKSPDFDAPRRSREFLRFVVEETVAGRGEVISQSTIATKVFGRKGDFDAILDPIVRIQAGRLRRSLERYYLLSGQQDPVRIELPKGTYVPVFGSAATARAEAGPLEGGAVAEADPRERRAAAIQSADGWPSIAVGKFESVHDGWELEEVARGLGEELAAELGGYRDVRVIRDEWEGAGPSRRHGGRFALNGRLRRENDELRVSARLVDRTTGEQVWGDEFHTTPKAGRWSATPDDIARVIAARVGSEQGVVVQLLIRERRGQGSTRPTPYDAMLRSLEYLLARDPAGFTLAMEALEQLVKSEPECAPAWARLARLYISDHAFELTPNPTPIDQAISCAHSGVRLDPTSRGARGMLAAALLVKGELTSARTELDEAIRHRPDSLVYLEMIGWMLTLCGDWERGRALTRSARERNPYCLPHVNFGSWFDHLHHGEFEAAYQAALEYRDPSFFWRALMRACSLGHLGRIPEARREVAEILRGNPDFKARGLGLIGHFVKFKDLTSRIVEGLGKAGLELE